MISEDMYNKIYSVLFIEEFRLENNIIEKYNFIIKYRPTDYAPYIDLLVARAQLNYFNRYIFPLLDWLENFIDSG